MRGSLIVTGLIGILCMQGCASHQIDPTKTGSIERQATSTPKPNPAEDIQVESVKRANKPVKSDILSMKDAVELASSRHPAVAEALGRVRQQDQLVVEARAGYLPKVSGGIKSDFDSALEGQWRPVFNVTASQMVYDFGKVASRIDAELAGKEERHAQLLGTLDGLAREAAGAVVEIDRYLALSSVAREQVQDTKHILDLVTSRTDKGASTKSDKLQAEARVQAAEASLLDIESQIRRWQSTLSALVGLPAPMKVNGTVPKGLHDACSRGEPDWSKVSTVMQAEADLKAADAQMRLSRAEIFPTLSLEGAVDADITNPVKETDYRVGLNASASLYNGGSLSARRQAAAFASAAAKAGKAKAMLEAGRNLSESAQQIGGLEQQQSLLKTRERTMNETRGLYETQYKELGTRTLLDLLNATDEFHEARFQRVNISHSIDKMRIDCLFFSGREREVFSIREPDL